MRKPLTVDNSKNLHSTSNKQQSSNMTKAVPTSTPQQDSGRMQQKTKRSRRESSIIILPAVCLIIVTVALIVQTTNCIGPLKGATYHHQTGGQGLNLVAHNHQCPSWPPLQWRPHLDTSSKAYLAPAVVLASLKEFSLSPIHLQKPLPGQQASSYHPQDINNNGVYIYATFSLSKELKNRLPDRINSTIRVAYRVSASSSTTTDLMQLAKSNTLSPASSLIQQQQQQQQQPQQQNSATIRFNQMLFAQRQLQLQQQQQQQQQTVRDGQVAMPLDQPHVCSLELSEQELEKKVNKLFKKNQNYILFLGQNKYSHHYQQQHQQQSSYYPIATHEPLNNQAYRAIQRIFYCKNCTQVPQVQLLNNTFVEEWPQSAGDPTPTGSAADSSRLQVGRPKVRLDCRITGFPAPWIQWYRNGVLLRNRANGRVSIRTSRWRRKHNVRVSQLELEVPTNKNSTSSYECRAMSVVAREPAVGVYNLVVQPGYGYALLPIQPPFDPSLAITVDSEPAASNAKQQQQQQQQQQQKQQQQATSNTGPPTSGSGRASPVAAGNQSAAGQQPRQEERGTSATANQQQANNATTQRPAPAQQTLAAASAPAPEATAAAAATTTTTTTTTTRRPTKASNSAQVGEQRRQESAAAADSKDPTQENKILGDSKEQQQQPVVGQSCPPGIHDTYCMNKGTCVLIGHIDEFYCNCPEGYEGHRCESKSFGHKKSPH